MPTRAAQLAGLAALALVLVAATLVAVDSRGLQTDVLVAQQATMQQLPEFSVAGTMQTGAPAPQGSPLSFQLPVPLPAPSPPAPTVITVGPRPKKAPVCKRCERQMRKIKRMVRKIKKQNEKADDLMEQQEEEKQTEDSVQLMTLHAAKGLEFPHVFMIGVEENLLPHRNSIDDGNIAEERRLAYVGITRAKQTLTMSYATSRRQFGETLDCEPSRFVEELPQEDLLFQGGGDGDETQARERANETLAGLKDLLA